MDSLAQMFKSAKPYLYALLIQFGFAGNSIICKIALDTGLSQHVLVVYCHAVVIAPVALVIDRNRRPTMTLSVLAKIMLLGLFGPVSYQNLYYTGMKYTSATFNQCSSCFCIFIGLCFKAKILGTVVTIGGAMLMTFLQGPMLSWTKGGAHQHTSYTSDNHHVVEDALMILLGIGCLSSFIILQAKTLQSYPAELSLVLWICLFGAIEGTPVALVLERHNLTAWSMHQDSKLLAVVSSAIISSGLGFYLQGLVMKERGPVFVSSFSPLSMIIVAIIGIIVLAETPYIGRVVGAIVIVVGLYMVLWVKSSDQDAPTTQVVRQS